MIAGCVFEGCFLMALGGLCVTAPAVGDKVLELVVGPVGLVLPSIQPELGQLLCFNLAYLGVIYIAMGLGNNRGVDQSKPLQDAIASCCHSSTTRRPSTTRCHAPARVLRSHPAAAAAAAAAATL